jgi:hypothetical protein
MISKPECVKKEKTDAVERFGAWHVFQFGEHASAAQSTTPQAMENLK